MADRYTSIPDLLRAVSDGTLVADAWTLGRVAEIEIERGSGRPAPTGADWRARVIRPDDLVVLEFRGINLVRSGKKLTRVAGQAASLVVTHQTQSLADAAYLNTSGQTSYNKSDLEGHEGATPAPLGNANYPIPVPIRAAGRSRLAFAMPPEQDSISFTLEALLDACRRWPLALDSAARAESGASTGGGGVLGGIAAELLESVQYARTALSATLNARQLESLDAAAGRIAADTVAGVRAGKPVADRTIDAAAKRELDALFPPKAEATSRAAGSLYLRAVAGQRAVAEMEHLGVDPGRLSQLGPGFYGVLQKPHLPATSKTAIEMPWRLIGSPLPGAGFTHATELVTHGGRTELWHTRLGARSTRILPGPNPVGGTVVVDDTAAQKLRYLWSQDYPSPPAQEDPKFSLAGLDRRMIVQLTSGYDEKLTPPDGGGSFTPQPVDTKRLSLSALGGLLDADKRWVPRPEGVDLLAWTHRLAQGRDAYVRVEYSGFLFPFGHAATLVKISERKFEWRAPGDRVAVLRQRYFLVIRERVRHYPNGAPQPDLGRTMPFEAIECTIATTPDLAEPGGQPDQRLPASFYTNLRPPRMAFWPARLDNSLFRFPLVGIDAAGRRIPIAIPLMFVSEVVNRSGPIEQIATHYNGLLDRRTADALNATMRFADGVANAADVDLPAQSLVFRSVNPVGGPANFQAKTLQQQPVVQSAKVKLATVERLTGQSQAPEVTFDTAYVANGWGPGNESELFLRITTPQSLAFGSQTKSDAVGGLATPNMLPAALSRRHGVMSGEGNLAAGNFNPADFFKGAKLLGVFDLASILKAVPLGNEAPKFTSVELADKIETRFQLSQSLPNSSIPALVLNPAGKTSKFDLTATTTLFRNGAPPDGRVEGTLTNFKLNLVGVLIIHFDRLRFLKVAGRKPDVDVDLNPNTGVTFGGPLEFINTLKDYIPSNGFSDPPDLQVTPDGITAGYTLGLPAIQCGILNLSNISLGAAFSLPFTGDAPTARFNFAERHNTFNLTVSLFGGGGFFAVVVGTGGVKEIEAALEFGAQVAINLGVASGSVYVKGGFYFHYAIDPDRIEFEGYVELGGRLSVLGLISVSLTFHLSLAYEEKQLPDKADGSPRSQSKLYGQATLVVEVEVLFFSASVSVKVEKTFAGSESDPLFKHFITDQSVWNDYCDAFA